MSTTSPSQPEPEPTARGSRDTPAAQDAAPAPTAAAALIFDDPLSQQSADDTDRGWGERPTAAGSAADLARFLDEKPPHHL
ncbi:MULTISPECIES: hypothetical protein [Streptomyces]|uniref:Uncharacterized protein n=1 Tax=Streptomyces yunnanensis TaxID=156453 RepID=A0ABY8AAU7_9ACTN|nr:MULTISPECIES: hypothetical protein [Streptomyces]AJC57827.1 hypothetical protein GZL_05250 [Streptomyces sp. 769]WEB42114.1 hypothetical protein MOV08_24545 [Streptomyces yunnanensis]